MILKPLILLLGQTCNFLLSVPVLKKIISEPTPDEKYRVRRTRFHNFPIYKLTLNGGNRLFTVVSKVQGNIWVRELNCLPVNQPLLETLAYSKYF